MNFKFEKLIIWQKAMDLAETINSIAQKFPKEELFNLSSQIRRAADSIALIFLRDQFPSQIWSKKGLWDMLLDHWPKW